MRLVLGIIFVLQLLSWSGADANQICIEDLSGGLTSNQLYDLLGRRDAKGGISTELFNQAARDPALRQRLNETIAQESYLQAASETGLEFRKDFEKFLEQKLPPGSGDIQTVVFPRKYLHDLWEAFKKTIRNLKDTPLTEQEATLLARAETAERFGLDPSYTNDDLLYRADAQDIQIYYNTRYNRYLLSENQKLAQDDTVDLRRFRIWLRKTVLNYQQRRAQNLIEALISISEFDHEKLNFYASQQKGFLKETVHFEMKDADSLEAEIFDKVNPADPDLNLTELYFNTEKDMFDGLGINKKNVWKRRLGQYVSFPDREKVRFSTLLKKKLLAAPDGQLKFVVTDAKFNGAMAKKLKAEGQVNLDRAEYSISIKNLYQYFDYYIDALGKSSLSETNNLANQLLLTYYNEVALADQIAVLGQQLEQPNIRGFDTMLQTTAIEESKIFDGEDAAKSTDNLFQRMRRLTVTQPNDALTGVEWYGYRVNNNFWINRDKVFAKNKLSHRLFGWARDKTSKMTRSVQAGIAVVALSVTMYITLPYYPDLFDWMGYRGSYLLSDHGKPRAPQPDPNAKKKWGGQNGGSVSGMNPDPTAKQKQAPKDAKGKAPKDQKDNSGGGAKGPPPVILETRSQLADSTGSYYDNINPAAPKYFDHASVIELQDSAILQKYPLPSQRPFETMPKWHGDSVLQYVRYHNTDSIFFSADSGYLFIPRPEGYDLHSLKLRDTLTHRTDVFEDVYIHPKTGQYMAKLKPEFRNSRFDIEAYFTRWVKRDSTDQVMERMVQEKTDTLPVNHVEFKDSRLDNMNPAKLRPIIDSIRSAGLKDLADSLDLLLIERAKAGQPVSLNDIGNTIAYTQWYNTDIPEFKDTVTANPFEPWRQFVKPDGKLSMKCDDYNMLLTRISKIYYQGEKDLRFGPYRSYVLDSTEQRPMSTPTEDGWIKSIGHERMQILRDGVSGTTVLDATAVNREPEPDKPEKEKEQPWFLKWPESTDPRRRPLLPERPSTVIEPPSKPEFHAEMVRKLREQTQKLLDLPGLKHAVQKNPGGSPLPQKIFTLGKNVLYFATQESSIESLNTALAGLFEDVGLAPANNEVTLVANLEQISDWLVSQWERTREYANSLNQATTDPKTLERLAWVDDVTLKNQVIEITNLLKSYHWHAPGGNP